jgi:hypothetical protein
MSQVAPIVAAMAQPRLRAARRGARWLRRLASRITMDAARISPSTVGGCALQ